MQKLNAHLRVSYKVSTRKDQYYNVLYGTKKLFVKITSNKYTVTEKRRDYTNESDTYI